MMLTKKGNIYTYIDILATLFNDTKNWEITYMANKEGMLNETWQDT